MASPPNVLIASPPDRISSHELFPRSPLLRDLFAMEDGDSVLRQSHFAVRFHVGYGFAAPADRARRPVL